MAASIFRNFNDYIDSRKLSKITTNSERFTKVNAMPEKILLTGGAGFIGSHTYVALVAAGFTPVIFDNLCNSDVRVLARLATITGVDPEFIRGNVCDPSTLNQAFSQHAFTAVIHLAGLKAVGESVSKPLEYYQNNASDTLELLSAMRRADVRKLVFSSSAAVHGNPASSPISENFPRSATSPYGRSKLIVENMLADLQLSERGWRIAWLRYFNPVGAHASGLIGENPLSVPNNLMPYIAQVAVGKQAHVNIYGKDYPTADGTSVRDYIHVMDLAAGHVAALRRLGSSEQMNTANLGTGRGISVMQMIRSFEAAAGTVIPFRFTKRRPGDIAECWADSTYATAQLQWRADRLLAEMCVDAWRWQSANPDGYKTACAH